jgi:hypothetical protein
MSICLYRRSEFVDVVFVNDDENDDSFGKVELVFIHWILVWGRVGSKVPCGFIVNCKQNAK